MCLIQKCEVFLTLLSFQISGKRICEILAMETFEYGEIKISQNQIEKDFFAQFQKSVGKGIRLRIGLGRLGHRQGQAGMEEILLTEQIVEWQEKEDIDNPIQQ